jgi:hypothetical protein
VTRARRPDVGREFIGPYPPIGAYGPMSEASAAADVGSRGVVGGARRGADLAAGRYQTLQVLALCREP